MQASLPLNYDNYIFDLYGTLVDIHTDESLPALWEKMSIFYGYYGAGYLPDELQSGWDLLSEQYRKEAAKNSEAALPLSPAAFRTVQNYEVFPEIDITRVIRTLYKKKGVDAGEELVVHTGQFLRVLSTEYIRLYEGTVQMLDALRQTGKKVWLLSNAQRIFTQYELRLLDIDRRFDGILISSDHGVGKPDARFFEQLALQYGIDFSRSLFIGNDAVNDIGGAQNVGMDSFYVHSNLSSVWPKWISEAVSGAGSGRRRFDDSCSPARAECSPRQPEKLLAQPCAYKISAPLRFHLSGTDNYTVMDFTGWSLPG